MERHESFRAHVETEGERWSAAVVRRLEHREAVSELFELTLDVAVRADESLADRAYPGASITVVLERDGLEVRRTHGLVTRVRDRLEDTGDHRSYEIWVRPRAFQLSLVETQEVHLDKTLPEVIAHKLELHGFGADDLEMRLVGDYPKREIVVQYGESDLAFVRRLAEHVGISFFFEHGEKGDKWVFTDHAHGFGTVEGAESAHYRSRGGAIDLHSLEVTTDLLPGTFFVQDYNYRAPLLDPTGEYALDGDAPGGIVEYGAHVKTPEEAAWLAKIRAEERLARKVLYDAESTLAHVTAGKVITVLDHPRLDGATRLLVTEVVHRASFPWFGEAGPTEASYRNAFRAIPADVVHRPRRATPKPRMPSVVTGVVQAGPNGEVGGIAKLTDDGRYTVQLHFDTAAHGQQKSSHPMRLSQPFAGYGNGMHFPLLPGTEVVVAFANGDPDRPVIVGALPNPVSPAPVVADEAHTHRIRSSQGVTIEFGDTVPGRK